MHSTIMNEHREDYNCSLKQQGRYCTAMDGHVKCVQCTSQPGLFYHEVRSIVCIRCVGEVR